MVRHSIMVGGTLSDVMTLDSTIVVFNDASNDINFRVESNNVTHALFVDAGNDCIGIGTSSPSPFRFHVDADASNNGIAKFNHSHATPEGIRIIYSAAAPDNTTTNFLECTDSSATRLQILGDGDIKNHDGTYGTISDERIKQNIVDANSQWDDIKAIKVRKYSLKEAKLDAPNMLGVVAQELETAGMNGLVYESPDRNLDGDDLGTTTKNVNYSVLYMKAVKALQETMARVEALEVKVAALEAGS